MSTIHEQVTEFHIAAGVPITETPTIPGDKERILRCKLILEEAIEFIQASGCKLVVLSYMPDCKLNKWDIRVDEALQPDIIEVADAIGDLNYVVEGAALTWGIPSDKVGDEVHRSNMSKSYPDGKFHRRSDGKIVKPDTFSPPDLAPILYPQTEYAQ